MEPLIQMSSVFFLTPKPIILVVAIVLISVLCVKRYRDLYYATGDLIQNTTILICIVYIVWVLMHLDTPEKLGISLKFVLVAVFWSTIVKMVFNYLTIKNRNNKTR